MKIHFIRIRRQFLADRQKEQTHGCENITSLAEVTKARRHLHRWSSAVKGTQLSVHTVFTRSTTTPLLFQLLLAPPPPAPPRTGQDQFQPVVWYLPLFCTCRLELITSPPHAPVRPVVENCSSEKVFVSPTQNTGTSGSLRDSAFKHAAEYRLTYCFVTPLQLSLHGPVEIFPPREGRKLRQVVFVWMYAGVYVCLRMQGNSNSCG